MSPIDKTVNNLNAVMIINNITTITSKGPEDISHNEHDCLSKYASFIFEEGAIFCNTTFDTYLCWPPTKANTVIQQNCPNVRLSDPSRFAYRKCGYKGLWEGRRPTEASPIGWTNFTPCFPPDIQTLFVAVSNDNDTQEHIISFVHIASYKECLLNVNLSGIFEKYNIGKKFEIAERIRTLEIVGYIASFIAIIFAIAIFCSYNSYLNKRFYLHKCLFISMLAQTLIYMTLYLDQAFNPVNDSAAQFSGNRSIYNTVTLCKILYVFMEASVTSTYTWIFLEGIYLNCQVSKKALQSTLDLKYYNIFGWGFPSILTLIWVIINLTYYEEEKIKTCWFGYNFAATYWFLQAPRLTILLVNFIILCRVMKIIVQKIKANRTSETEKIKKSVKAAFLLIPLLGVTNILSTFDISLTTSLAVFTIWCYSRQFLKSFQGLFLAFTYCFFNNEVCTIIKRRYNNRRKMGLFGIDRFSKPKLRRTKKKDLNQPQLPTITGNEAKDDQEKETIEKSQPNIRPAAPSDTVSDKEECEHTNFAMEVEMHTLPEFNRNNTENINTTIIEETSFMEVKK